MKFAHIADAHLGREQFQQPFRYRDYLNAFRQAIEKSIDERVDFILLAGDLFHVSKPSPKAIRDAVEILNLVKKKDIPVFAIEGNHDKTIRETSIYDLLEHLGLIYTVGIKKTPRESEFQKSVKKGNLYLVYGVFGDIEIYGLRHNNRWQLIKNGRSILKSIFRGGSNSVLMLHQAIDYLAEGTPYKDAFDLKLSEIPEGFRYYALGHIHMKKELRREESGLSGDIIYPGSLERTEIREASHRITYDRRISVKKLEENIKGFYVVEDFEPRFVEIEARPFYNVLIKGNSKIELRNKISDIKEHVERDSIVLITLEGVVKGGVHVSEFYDLLKDWDLSYYNFNNRVSSEVVGIDPTKTVDELLNEILSDFERELFLQLANEPRKFSEELDNFIDWLMDVYKHPKSPRKAQVIEEEHKEEQKEDKPKLKGPKAKTIDAWLGMR
ncbi:exonuclease SbcCD subunit D [Thermococcus sp. MV5]|uniref:metallophosphoesterase family protein n=1 Tax=Thermococcus sp. MV5 TaxID=1638272 RepID=UPI00143B334D|nr:exonuclease SbcCD subunit D [Thermococcus sp. MV5]NJE25974.1 exonuclease SbcCD subunit D [Thermococcus sp. MV5]